MSTLGDSVTVQIRLTCIDAPQCKVFFEPEGAEVVLSAGDWFNVEISGPPPAITEVSFVPDGIIVTAWRGADTRVRNRAGKDLDV